MSQGTSAVTVAAAVRAEVGEGPAWDDRIGVVWWVDILVGAVHRFDPARGQDEVIEVGQPVGAVVPRNSEGLALALEHTFVTFDPATQELVKIHDIEPGREETRVNDGKCDRQGRFWVGTMAYDWQSMPDAGSLYRLDPDGRLTKVLSDLAISNGLAWSADDDLLYFIDSPTQRVDVFDFDAETGTVSGRRTVVAIPDASGMPDGMSIDADGFLWVALWGGGAVWRIDPADGRVDRVIEVPASQVTSCVFGGADLRDLYITTAAIGLSPDALAAQPLAGSMFRCRPGVQGTPTESYRG
jgi:sugar lactone lactonase YvrE